MGVTPPTKINAKGKVTFAFAKTDPGLKALLEHENPDVQAIVSARLQVKTTIEETRALAYYEASKRGAWPVAYNYAGALVTQRYSGNKGGGGNPQNLKRGGELRRCVVAPEGYRIGVADWSQIEARITLWIGAQISGPDSPEAEALADMAAGGDLYSWFGSRVYGFTITKKTHPLERQMAKSAVLGLGFGMGRDKFIEYCQSQGVKISEEMAETLVKFYRKTFRGVVKSWYLAQKLVKSMTLGEYGHSFPTEENPLFTTDVDPVGNAPCLRRPNTMTIKYPELSFDADEGLRYNSGRGWAKLFGGKIVENIVQAIAADGMRERKVELHRHFRAVLTTHDEIGSLVKLGDEEQFISVVNEVMLRPISYLPGMPLDIEYDIAERYGDAK